MSPKEDITKILDTLAELAPDWPYFEVWEDTLLEILCKKNNDRTRAVEIWEAAQATLRQRVFYQGRLFEWDFFRRLITVTRPLRIEELDLYASISEVAIPSLFEIRLRSLSGRAFEKFLGELLRRLPSYRDVVVTKASRDGGIDFTATYQPDEHGPPRTLIGQAKQTLEPVSAPLARDFIGALNVSGGGPGAFGLYVSVSGYTKDAADTFEKANYQIQTWDLKRIQVLASENQIGIRSETGKFLMVDTTFWDEIGNS